jgi:ribosomal protein S18 acetylase RimI-like enzyme
LPTTENRPRGRAQDRSATIQLRPYAPADFQNIYEIDQACYEPRVAYSRTELRQYLRFPGADCVIAEATQGNSADEQHEKSSAAARGRSSQHGQAESAHVEESGHAAPEMIGFCIAAHRGPWGYIVTMDVLAAYRRLGVGSLLIAEAERRMISGGVREIGLETATDNAPAIAFWQRHGYRKSGVRKNYYPGGRDAYSMAKRIAAVQPAANGK